MTILSVCHPAAMHDAMGLKFVMPSTECVQTAMCVMLSSDALRPEGACLTVQCLLVMRIA